MFWRVFAGVLLRTERCGKLRRFAAKNATKTKTTRKKFPFEVPGIPLITGKLTGRLGPYGKPLTRGGTVLTGRASPLREAPYGEGRSLREGPVLTGSPLSPLRADRLTGRPLTGRLLMGRPLTNYRKAYGNAYGKGSLRGGALLTGRLRLGPYERALPTGSPLRGGTVLTGRAGPGCLTVTEKDDEEAYGKAEPLREAPYGEGRSLREGPVLTERAGVPYGSLHKEGRRRGLRPLREGKIPYGPYGKGR